jgi:predicted enzyme related to lactoylglutathione lyase
MKRTWTIIGIGDVPGAAGLTSMQPARAAANVRSTKRSTPMRSAILAMTVALTLGSGRLQATPAKSPPADVGPGRIAWFDLTTTSLAKSKEFYGKLFDWTFTPLQGTDLAVEIVAGGTPIGSLRLAEGAISSFNGVVYVQVTDILASCKKANELGGAVVPGFPFNLSERPGAIALVHDPAGHPVGMYSRTPVPEAAPAVK